MRYTDAILGVEAEVPTIHGQARLRIPAGTQSGQVLTMRGAGISPGAAGLASADGILRIGAGDSQRGAHHFTVIVLLPHQASPSEQAHPRLALYSVPAFLGSLRYAGRCWGRAASLRHYNWPPRAAPAMRVYVMKLLWPPRTAILLVAVRRCLKRSACA